MAIRFNPYINFNGNAKEAMEFYHTVFGGKMEAHTYAEYHASHSPSDDNLIMHSMLESDNGIYVMAADVPSNMEYKPGNNFSLSLSGDDEAQLGTYFEKLSEGGLVTMALAKSGWGDTFGMCVDKFGVSWLVNISAQNAPQA